MVPIRFGWGFLLRTNCKSFAITCTCAYTDVMRTSCGRSVGARGRFSRTAAALLLILPLCSCSRAETAKPKIVTTSLPVYCFTANVAGDLAAVENLLPGNASVHDYQFTPQDARKLANASLLIVSGLGLETWLEPLLRSSARRTKVVEAAEGLGAQRIRTEGHDEAHGEHDHGEWNPHFWLDPTLAAHAVTNIMRSLQTADPSNAAGYASNAAAYVERLHKLDRELAETLGHYKGTPIVTYHDAFPYFAQRYQLKIVGVIEPVPDVDPTPRELSQLRKRMLEENVRVVFVEKDSSSRLADRIRDDLKVKLAPLDPLESGDLSPEVYENGMRRNLETLKKIFDASLP